MQAGYERALQGFGDEGVLLGAKISLRGAGAFAGFAYGGQINKSVAVAIDEIFEQARDFGLLDGVFDMVDEAGEGEDLPFADQLLREVGLKKLNFLG